jgi:hypothetical protein
MKIIEIRNIENCVGVTNAKEIVFEEPVKYDFIRFLGKEGNLQYFPSFPRPFFKIEVEGKYILKGIEGEKIMKIVLIGENETALKSFVEYAEGYALS